MGEFRGEVIKTARACQPEDVMAFVGDTGIYVPSEIYGCHKLLISRELFIEAYNKYIKGEKNESD